MFRQAPLTATPQARRLFVAPECFEDLVAYSRRGYNVLVVAERGGGKTSSLRQLELMLRDEPHADDPVVAFVDLRAAHDVDEALALILRRGRSENGIVPSSAADDPVFAPEDRGVTERLLGALGHLSPTRFILDNAEPDAVGYALFGGLRDRLWDTRHSFVVAADESDASAFLRPPADAFWEQVVTLTLNDVQAVELIERRADGDADWARALAEAVGPHPRRLIGAAQRIASGVEAPPSVAAAYRDRRERLGERSAMARRVFHELEDLGPMSPSDERLLRRIGASRPALDRALRELESEGLARSYFEPSGPGRPRRVYEPVPPQRSG
jgi:hypothetical protein